MEESDEDELDEDIPLGKAMVLGQNKQGAGQVSFCVRS